MVDIIILSGGSGSGKSSLAHELEARYPDAFEVIRSLTTRKPREDNEFYSFVSDEEFLSWEKAGALLESNRYEGNHHLYGTPVLEVQRVAESGRAAVLDIDVNGREQIINGTNQYSVLSVFIVAPVSVVYDRLLKRGESHEKAVRRISASIKEMEKGRTYDAVIVNTDFNKALTELYDVTMEIMYKPIDLEGYIEDAKKFMTSMKGMRDE